MNIKKELMIFGVILLGFIVVSLGSSGVTMLGVNTNFLPTVPYIGAIPVVGAAIFYLFWKFWGKKQAQ